MIYRYLLSYSISHSLADQCRGEGQAVKQFLNYIDRDVPFNSLNSDCIDRVITPDIDFRIPLDWEKFRDLRSIAEGIA